MFIPKMEIQSGLDTRRGQFSILLWHGDNFVSRGLHCPSFMDADMASVCRNHRLMGTEERGYGCKVCLGPPGHKVDIHILAQALLQQFLCRLGIAVLPISILLL